MSAPYKFNTSPVSTVAGSVLHVDICPLGGRQAVADGWKITNKLIKIGFSCKLSVPKAERRLTMTGLTRHNVR